MNIEILGTRGNIDVQTPQYARQSGILVDEKILLDLGEKEYLNLDFDSIFISHLHADHAIFEEEDIPEISVPVYAPEPSSHYPVKVLSHPVTIDAYRVTPLPTIHSTRVTSVALLVEKDVSLLYTSDLVALSHEFSRQVDLAVIDGSFMRKKGLVRRTEKGEQ
ncbi:MAG: hypothetical protein HXS47_11050, partial [Theionarchaea archaeon]|nr:hypothetical protein [Theionarchaea archaeon]